MKLHHYIKQQLIGLLLVTLGNSAKAQTWETGLAINETHLWQSDSYVDYTGRTEGLGVSIMARYQNPTFFFLLKNNEIGFEHSRGEVWIQQHTSPGGSGGDYTYLKYSTTSFTLNNYFANFGTLKKGFQVSMGLHYNYKINTHSDGYYKIRNNKWDTLGHVWAVENYYSLDGKNNPEICRFKFGPTVGIAFRPFQVGKLNLRSRYDISTTVFGELNNGMDFNNLRQRFTLSIVWDKQK